MSKRALIVIDVQNEYVTGNFLIEYPPVEQSLANIGRAIDAAHAAAIPVVVVQHTAPFGAPIFDKGTDGWELHPVVAGRHYDYLVEKKQASSFAGTELAEWLKRQGIDTLSVIGYMTHNCNVATIFDAKQAGLAVEFLADASGSLPYANRAGQASAEEIHRVFSVVLESNFAAVLSTAEWVAALPSGQAVPHDNIYASNQRGLQLAAEHV